VGIEAQPIKTIKKNKWGKKKKSVRGDGKKKKQEEKMLLWGTNEVGLGLALHTDKEEAKGGNFCSSLKRNKKCCTGS